MIPKRADLHFLWVFEKQPKLQDHQVQVLVLTILKAPRLQKHPHHLFPWVDVPAAHQVQVPITVALAQVLTILLKILNLEEPLPLTELLQEVIIISSSMLLDTTVHHLGDRQSQHLHLLSALDQQDPLLL
jgi:hypothetical protein